MDTESFNILRLSGIIEETVDRESYKKGRLGTLWGANIYVDKNVEGVTFRGTIK